MTRFLPLGLSLLLLLALPALAQDEEEQQPAQRCGDLPPPVAKTHDAIRAAAGARDYAALATLIDSAIFTYSFGDEGGDPITFWKGLASDGTDVPATMVALLDMPCVTFQGDEGGPYYEWPSAAEVPYPELAKEEVAALDELYAGHLADNYIEDPETGYYVGWRILIDKDGRWTAFVAGD
jgi:hypothetical protein